MNPPLESSLHVEPYVHHEVAGWLLFLCVILAVVAPAFEISNIFKKLIPLFMRVHGRRIMAFLAIDIAIRGGLAAHTCVAGVELWLVKPGAVGFAKRCLILRLIGGAAIFGAWAVLVGPSKADSYDRMVAELIVAPLFQALIWYFYLATSVRVRETFSDG